MQRVATQAVLLFLTATIWCGPANAAIGVIKGRLICSVPDNAAKTATPIPFVPIAIAGAGQTTSDASGSFSIAVSNMSPLSKVHVTLTYEGTVITGPPALPTAVATPLQVMDDVFNTRGDDSEASGTLNNGTLDLGTVTVSSTDCEAWRIGAAILDDYHKVARKSPPAERLRIMRTAGVVTGTEYTFYDYIRVRADFLSDKKGAWDREAIMFHEFGHTVRHVFDGDINHWNCDDFRWAYARTHCGNEVFNMQYAFNEGWADYWSAARHGGYAPYDAKRECGSAPSEPGNTDWVEMDIANALINLDLQLQHSFHMTGEQAAAMMLLALNRKPRVIHSLYAFSKSLAELVSWPAPTRPEACPVDYHNDGLTCRKDVVVQAKPSYGRGVGTPRNDCDSGKELDAGLCYNSCKSGYHGVGPVCWGSCRAGYHDDGATCRTNPIINSKSSYGRGAGTPPTRCGVGRDMDAGLCYPACNQGYSGVGPVCWEQCRDGYHDDGATCRRNARIIGSNNSHCPWYDKCGLTLSRGCSKCPVGYHNDGCTCRIDVDIYGKSSYGRGAGTVPNDCGDGNELNAGLCYRTCKPGYHGVGPVCWGSCPASYHDDGATCRKDGGIMAKSSYGRGAGAPPTGCNGGKEENAGLCYDSCRSGYHGVGPVCWGQCPTGFDDHGGTCYVGTSIIIRGGECNAEPWDWY